MKVLVTGITGLLGRYLINSRPRHISLHGTSRGTWPIDLENKVQFYTCDPSNFDQLDEILTSIRPSVVIHAAAEGRVDVVQGHAWDFLKLNVELPVFLAQRCATLDCRYVFISSNAVFGGSREDYDDASSTCPVNDYGRLKAAAEFQILAVNPASLIFRPLLMYGWPLPDRRSNPVAQWIEQLSSGRRIDVVNDIWTQPLYAEDCSRAIWTAIESRARGVFNVSGGQSVTLFQLAILVCEAFGFSIELVRPVASTSFSHLAPRPIMTSFNLRRAVNELGWSPRSINEGLRAMRETRDSMNCDTSVH